MSDPKIEKIVYMLNELINKLSKEEVEDFRKTIRECLTYLRTTQEQCGEVKIKTLQDMMLPYALLAEGREKREDSGYYYYDGNRKVIYRGNTFQD